MTRYYRPAHNAGMPVQAANYLIANSANFFAEGLELFVKVFVSAFRSITHELSLLQDKAKLNPLQGTYCKDSCA